MLSQLGNSPKILFVGNSHTIVNNVPESVRQLLASDSSHRKANVRSVSVGLLETAGPDVETAIKSEKWDVVILQGAQVSSSHKYRYSQAKGDWFCKSRNITQSKSLALCRVATPGLG